MPCTPGSRLSSGTTQSSRNSSEVIEARRLNLPCISRRAEARACRARPGSRAPSSPSRVGTFAHTSATSATSPLVIQRLVPLSTVAAVDRHGARQHAGRVGAEVGLGEAEAADRLAARQARQPVALLRLGAEGVDRVHHQAGLHADERAQARVAALELLVDQPVGDVVQPGAAVLRSAGWRRRSRARRPARASSTGKVPSAEVLGDDRQVLLLDELPRRVARQASPPARAARRVW